MMFNGKRLYRLGWSLIDEVYDVMDGSNRHVS